MEFSKDRKSQFQKRKDENCRFWFFFQNWPFFGPYHEIFQQIRIWRTRKWLFLKLFMFDFTNFPAKSGSFFLNFPIFIQKKHFSSQVGIEDRILLKLLTQNSIEWSKFLWQSNNKNFVIWSLFWFFTSCLFLNLCHFLARWNIFSSILGWFWASALSQTVRFFAITQLDWLWRNVTLGFWTNWTNGLGLGLDFRLKMFHSGICLLKVSFGQDYQTTYPNANQSRNNQNFRTVKKLRNCEKTWNEKINDGSMSSSQGLLNSEQSMFAVHRQSEQIDSDHFHLSWLKVTL